MSLISKAFKPDEILARVRLTESAVTPTLKAMEVHLSPDVQAKLTRLAAAQGRDTLAPAQEAIARFVDYDEWFICEVETGLASADRDELLTHEEVGARLEKLIAEKQSRR
jgi:predicted transcriptional regulator